MGLVNHHLFGAFSSKLQGSRKSKPSCLHPENERLDTQNNGGLESASKRL